MKIRYTYTVLLLFMASFFAMPSCLIAQSDANEAHKFNINIVKEGSNVTLKCTQGCNWDTLTLKEDNTAIDATGVVDTKNTGRATSFLFDIKKTAAGVTLTGLKGTQWAEPITIKCENSCKFSIAHYGLPQ